MSVWDRQGTAQWRVRWLLTWFFIIAVPWVSGGVALAMLLTGHAGG